MPVYSLALQYTRIDTCTWHSLWRVGSVSNLEERYMCWTVHQFPPYPILRALLHPLTGQTLVCRTYGLPISLMQRQIALLTHEQKVLDPIWKCNEILQSPAEWQIFYPEDCQTNGSENIWFARRCLSLELAVGVGKRLMVTFQRGSTFSNTALLCVL